MDFHPTADEVHHRVRQRIPKVSLGTIYRNLEQMTANRQIRRLEWAGSPRRYEGNLADHHHLRCLQCGDLKDLPGAPWKQWVEALADQTNYNIVGCRVELTGFCPRCRNREKEGAFWDPESKGAEMPGRIDSAGSAPQSHSNPLQT